MTFNNLYWCSVTGIVICLIIRIFNDNEALNEVGLVLDLFISKVCQLPRPRPTQIMQLSAKTFHSSVWCLSDVDGHKICTFKNLCYVPLEKQFIFILSNDSVLSGIKTKSELKSLELSSLLNHNQFTMNIAIVLPGHKILNRKLVNGSSVYILWRFKWDNVMHVIHDDLLPLYMTYSNICSGDIDRCVSKFRLAILDSGDNTGPLNKWYELFSNAEPLLLRKQSVDTILCFDEVGTGLIRSSTWFQYGFGIPQGSLNNTELSGNTIRQFSHFVTRKFRIEVPLHDIESTRPTAILFSRRINRKILNEDFLLKVMNDTYHSAFPRCEELNIISMDLSVNDTKSILESLLQSKVVVGMHGAIMIFSMFLPPGSVVVELFPFGIVPEYVSPLKALSHIYGIDFVYESWQNMEENHSLAHPEALPIFGGIAHLSEAEQHRVKRLIPIPAMECCHNPAYLYRMFQDTLIAPDFISTLQQALKRQKQFRSVQQTNNFIVSRWWYPASISNATCELTPVSLNINWNPSINVEETQSTYELTIVGNKLNLEFASDKTILKIALPIGRFESMSDQNVDVWIKCVVAGEESVDTHVKCNVT